MRHRPAIFVLLSLAIVGSRCYPRCDLVGRLLLGILEPGRQIITGDAAARRDL